MKYWFISGIPAAGKSYLAKKVAADLGLDYYAVDEWREELIDDPELGKWVKLFWEVDEEKYWQTTSPEQHWQNLVDQSEALWPQIKVKIKEIQDTGRGAIFEGVNIVPHLAKDLDFSGIVLLGESYEQILDRNKKDPRWGNTEELQVEEAKAFWEWERPKYESESNQYGFKTFSGPMEAEEELRKILG